MAQQQLRDDEEAVECIKFFGALVSTPGVDAAVMAQCNAYILKLLEALGKTVDLAVQATSDIKIIKGNRV